jgi:hypothetical protein
MTHFNFYIAQGKSREGPLMDAWARGAASTGDTMAVHPNSVEAPAPGDVAVMVGLKSIELRQQCLAAGQRVLTFDKGYDRKHDWWRVSIDEHQPTKYLMTLDRPDDRMRAAGWNPAPWKIPADDDRVIIAGGGRKYYITHDLPEPVDYVSEIVAGIRAAGCKRKIWYRPKPSMSDVLPVPDTTLSRHKSIYEILETSCVLVTFGSNACFEAMLAGVPSIILGDAVARPISSVSLTAIENPICATDVDRLSWLSTLAYCQFRLGEIASGMAVDELKAQLREVVSGL